MENWFEVFVLAIVQGITEWIPVSSSGHLVLFEKILNFNAGLVFDVALHFGTLMAVFVYFGKDIVDIIEDLLKGKFRTENGKLGILLIVATIPAALIGFLFKELFENIFKNLGIVALGFGITSLVLFIASLEFRSKKKEIPTWKDSILIGIAQAFSILPGVSRSGLTISSGLLLGLKEKQALKFSFLMSIPIIFGANILEIGANKLPSNLIWATLVSFFVGILVLHLLYNYILTSKKNLRWFAAYALLLAIGVGVWVVFG